MNKLFACTLMLFATAPSLAADANGYTTQYECRAGGRYCNVDVEALAAQACDAIITPSDTSATINKKLNGSSNVICVQKGDYTGTGTWTLATSGTADKRKVLRYYSNDDTNTDPWKQAPADRARLYRIDVNAKYWLIHRLAFDDNNREINRLLVKDGSDNAIISRVLIENFDPRASDGAIFTHMSADVTIQNSVVRNCGTAVNQSPIAIQLGYGPNTHVVNNEVYDCTITIYTHATGIPAGDNKSSAPGTVVENNDAYLTTAFYTDCKGNWYPNPDAPCSAQENGVVTKAAGTQAKPYQFIHNRMWGFRACDTNVACDGGGTAGTAMYVGATDDGSADWVLVKNNVFLNSEIGIGQVNLGPVRNNSYVGNLLYHIYPYTDGKNGAIDFCCSAGSYDKIELSFNTVIDGTVNYGWLAFKDATNSDVKCNAIIASTAATSYYGSGTEIDSNAYYGTNPNADQTKISQALEARTANTFYSVGDIIRLSTNPSKDCNSTTDQACFMYRVTTAGTTAPSSSAAYCTAPGCTTTDGSVNVVAIRGPYELRRKLKTVPGGESFVIPYAKPYISASETGACTVATRQGLGMLGN